MTLCKWCQWCVDNSDKISGTPLPYKSHPPHKNYLDSTCECRDHCKSTNDMIGRWK